jgi:hypothetical protein
MKFFSKALAAPAVLCVVLSIGAASAHATCYSSTQSNQSYADSAADGDYGLAPEIAGAAAVTDSQCGIGMAPAITNRPYGLGGGDASAVYIDTDGNSATGDPTFDGADKVVMTIGSDVTEYPPRVGSWNGSTMDFAAGPNLTPSQVGGFIASFDQLGIAAPATLGLRFITDWEGTYDTYFDFAPEAGAAPFTFPVSFSTSAPPPPPPPALTPAPAPPAPVTTAPTAAPTTGTTGCIVPRVKGMAALSAASKLSAAHCKFRFKRVKSGTKKGRVVRTSPGAGRTTASTITVFVSKGRRRAQGASVAPYAAADQRLRALAEFGLR